jgi:hypothetical protein
VAGQILFGKEKLLVHFFKDAVLGTISPRNSPEKALYLKNELSLLQTGFFCQAKH